MRTSPRRRAREFVLQGLYQRQLSGNPHAAIREQVGNGKVVCGLSGGVDSSVAALLVRRAVRRLGGVTGDVMGATVETASTTALLVAALTYAISLAS